MRQKTALMRACATGIVLFCWGTFDRPQALDLNTFDVKIEIFDKESDQLQETRGQVLLGDWLSHVTDAKIVTGKGTILCQGQRTRDVTNLLTNYYAGTASGNCFGVPGTGNWSWDKGLLNFEMRFKGSWVRVEGRNVQ